MYLPCLRDKSSGQSFIKSTALQFTNLMVVSIHFNLLNSVSSPHFIETFHSLLSPRAEEFNPTLPLRSFSREVWKRRLADHGLCLPRDQYEAVTSYLGHLVISPPFPEMRCDLSSEMSSSTLLDLGTPPPPPSRPPPPPPPRRRVLKSRFSETCARSRRIISFLIEIKAGIA